MQNDIRRYTSVKGAIVRQIGAYTKTIIHVVRSISGINTTLLTHGILRGGTSDAIAFKGQHKHHLLASSNSQFGRPVGIYSGITGGALADGVLVPAASVAVTEQL